MHRSPRIYSPSEHTLSPDQVDPDALWVLHRLSEEGFSAFLVGGGVRDLLMHRTPKDFDIATSAKPEEVKKIFGRRCLLIGRRFRLAHVRFGSKVIEVATFRAGDINDTGLIVRDNEWGDPEEDALRRDFTINGLYYDAEANQVIDYIGGFEDISKNLLRTIGNPVSRFKQDPVRMLRLLKFQARFGMEADKETELALQQCVDEITKSSPARILEEIFRMLESGAAEPFFRLIADTGILDLLFPALSDFFQGPYGKEVYHLLNAADTLILEGATIDRAVLASCLIYPILERELADHFKRTQELAHLGDIISITHSLIHGIVSSSFFQFPRRMRILIAFALTTQYRITPTDGKRGKFQKSVRHRDFKLALDLFRLRSHVTPDLQELCSQLESQWEGEGTPPKPSSRKRPPQNRRRRTRRPS